MSLEQTHSETLASLAKCMDDLSDIHMKIQYMPHCKNISDEYKQALIDYEVENYKNKLKKICELQRSFYCWEVSLKDLKCGV